MFVLRARTGDGAGGLTRRRETSCGWSQDSSARVPRPSSNHMRTTAPEWEPTTTRCPQGRWERWSQKCVTFLILAVLLSFSLREKKDPGKVRTGWGHLSRCPGLALCPGGSALWLLPSGCAVLERPELLLFTTLVAGPHQTFENVYNFLLIQYLSVHFSINTAYPPCWPDLRCPTPSKYLSITLKFDCDKVIEGIF